MKCYQYHAGDYRENRKITFTTQQKTKDLLKNTEKTEGEYQEEEEEEEKMKNLTTFELRLRPYTST